VPAGGEFRGTALALNRRTFEEPRSLMLKQRLVKQGYTQSERQPFIFHPRVSAMDREKDTWTGVHT
jgi:hypothetical protein